MPPVPRVKIGSPRQKDTILGRVPFNTFIRHFKTEETTHKLKTHTSINPKGKFYVDSDSRDEVFEKYTHAISKKESLTILELPQNKTTKLRADFDFKFNEIKPFFSHFYSNDMVKECVRAYRTAIGECLVQVDNTVYIHEKKSPRTEEGFIKDGFHIVFPYIGVKQPVFDKIFTRATEIIEQKKVFSNLSTVSEVCDPISKSPWLMYGSAKDVGKEPYLCTYGLDSDEGKIEPPSDPIRAFSIFTDKEAELKPNINLDPYTRKNKINRGGSDGQEWYDKNKGVFEKIMEHMDIKRLDNREDWVKLMFFCVSHGIPEELAMEWSQKSEKFDEGGFWRLWNSADPDKTDVGVGTLVKYLQDDLGVRETTKLLSPVSRGWNTMDTATERVKKTYEILDNKWTAVRFARLFDYFFGEDVVFVSKKTCFHWNEKTALWEQVDSNVVEAHITDSLIPLVEEVYTYLSSILISFFSNDNDREAIKKVQSSYFTILMELEKGCKTSNAIFKYLLGKKLNPKFRQKIDHQTHLLSVKNGVVDLRTKELRPRRRDDYMSFSTPYEYDPKIDTSKCHDFLMDLCLDNQSKKKWLHKWLGYGATGDMTQEIFVMFVGVNHTGKDTLRDRCTFTLGNKYVFDASIDTFLDNQGSSLPAMSEIAHMEGSRMVFTTEPGPKDKFKGELLKTITGQTAVSGKLYHQDPHSFLPQCKINFTCNHKPKLEATGAIQRRAVEFRLEAQFRDVGDSKDPYDPNNDFHRKRIPSLKASFKTKQACEEWLAFTIEGARAYYLNPDLKKNLPSDVLESTQDYFEENKDFVVDFSKEHLNIHHNVGANKKRLINRTLVHKRYLEWIGMEDDIPEFVPYKPSTFYTHLTTKCGIRGKMVKGSRVFEVSFKISQVEWDKRVEAHKTEKG